MIFNVLIDNETIKRAAEIIKNHQHDFGFHARLCGVKIFNHTNNDGKEVSLKILVSEKVITIKPYTTWNPFSKAIGYASKDVIYCNTRKFDLLLEERIENLFHEAMHCIGYAHKGNYVNDYNLETVPYKGARMFKEYVIEKGSTTN